MSRAAALLLAIALAGCLGAPVAEPEEPVARAWAFAEALDVDADVIASEPDVLVLPSGTALACGVGRRNEEQMYLWRREPDGPFERMAHPDGDGVIDCAFGQDAGGLAYYATSAGGSLTVATTRDGNAWLTAVSLASPAGAYDRPWIAGGEAGHALLVAYHAREALEAWATEDGGVTWSGPFDATPAGALVFQTFGNLVWRGGDAYAFAYGPLEPHGAGLEPRDLRLAATIDAGATWASSDIALERGNLNNIFPWLAADPGSGRLAVAWAETAEGRGAVVHVSESVDGAAWSAPEPVHGADIAGLMPRLLLTPGGPVVVMYAAEGVERPSWESGSWDVVAARRDTGAWQLATVASGVHEGSVAAGGYGAITTQLVASPGSLGTQNSQELLHHLGAALLPDGRVLALWASDAEGSVGLRAAEQRA